MNNRWIDQYLLRYAVGSIVGSVIVAYLLMTLRAALHFQTPILDSWGKMTALGAAGLAFCYIASAPLLVFHVAREFFFARNEEKKHYALVSTICFTLVSFFGFHCMGNIAATNSIAYAALLAIIFAQGAALWVLKSRRDKAFSFYKELARARTAESSDIVESYRGIREHGNAYAIVFLEALLGLILIGLLDEKWMTANVRIAFGSLLGLVGIWVFPAALILFAASRMETDFVDDTTAATRQTKTPDQT